jgi:hypothetical protein
MIAVFDAIQSLHRHFRFTGELGLAQHQFFTDFADTINLFIQSHDPTCASKTKAPGISTLKSLQLGQMWAEASFPP